MRIGNTPALLLAAFALCWQGQAEAFFFCFNLGSGNRTGARGARPPLPPPPPVLGAGRLLLPTAPPPTSSPRRTASDARGYETVQWPAGGSREYRFRPLDRDLPAERPLAGHRERF